MAVEASKSTLNPFEGSGTRSSTRYARITVNFVHDMSTGTWAACMLVIWSISSRIDGVSSEAAEVLAVASRDVFWLLVLSLIGLSVTGVARLFYWRADTPVEQRSAKRSALIAKHVVFLVVYGLGSLWAARQVF